MRFYLKALPKNGRTYRELAQEKNMHPHYFSQKQGWSLKTVITYNLWEFVDPNKMDEETIEVYEQIKHLLEKKEDN